MTINKDGLDFLVSLEGFKLKPYLDIKKVPTIGIGSTYYENGEPVKMNDSPISKEEAYRLFELTKSKYEKPINDTIKVKLTQNQFNALFAFCYNVGATGFKNSTLARVVNIGSDRMIIENAFMMWRGKNKNKSGQFVLQSRRQAEINKYFES